MENQLKLLTTFGEKLTAFGRKYDEEYGKLPYRINLIDELHADENAHTRIFVKLLKYNRNQDFTILESFLQRFLPEFYFELKQPSIKFNKEFIDAMIEDKDGKYAIIIENKIHGAGDQDKQIERYIKTARRHGIPKECIYVIYLTNNGDKIISSHSFTDKAKEILEYKDEESQGRFTQMSYRYDILPWLEVEILPNCTLKESWLISAITQYIDHLKGMFKLRKEMEPMNKELEKMLKEQLGINGSTDKDLQIIEKQQNLIDEYQKTLGNLKSALVETNPWAQQKSDLAIWLANKIQADFEKKNQDNKLFGGVRLHSNVRVCFSRLYFKNHPFVIDINCKDMRTDGLSFFVRDEPKDKLTTVQQKEMYFESFGFILQSKKIELEFTNGRWRKTFSDITTWNKTSLNNFYEFLDGFLKSLADIVHSGK